MRRFLTFVALVLYCGASPAGELQDYVLQLNKVSIDGKEACGKYEDCARCFENVVRGEMVMEKFSSIIKKDREYAENFKLEEMTDYACRNLFEGLEIVQSWGDRSDLLCRSANVKKILKEKAAHIKASTAPLREALKGVTLESCIADWNKYEAKRAKPVATAQPPVLESCIKVGEPQQTSIGCSKGKRWFYTKLTLAPDCKGASAMKYEVNDPADGWQPGPALPHNYQSCGAGITNDAIRVR